MDNWKVGDIFALDVATEEFGCLWLVTEIDSTRAHSRRATIRSIATGRLQYVSVEFLDAYAQKEQLSE